jgi:molecular chaperone GrpE
MKEEESEVVQELNPDLQQQADEFKEKYYRALAEGENVRKRLAKEKQEVLRFGIDNVICDFLPAIDQFEHALSHAEAASADVKNWAMGFQMILSQFKEVLHSHGISSYISVGQVFDPSLHEAIEMVETSETPEGTILQECTKGYKSALRTLRAARVKVAKAPTPELKEEEQKGE